HELRIQALVAANRLQAAASLRMQVVERLGFPLAPPCPRIFAGVRLAVFRALLRKADRLRPMRNAKALAAMRVMTHSLFAMIAGMPDEAIVRMASRMARLTLRYGKSPSAPLAFMMLGISSVAASRIDQGYRMGELALRDLARPDARSLRPA